MTRIRNATFIFTQQLDSNYWNWEKDELQFFRNPLNNIKEIYTIIFNRLKSLEELNIGESNFKLALILHDQDKNYDGELIEPHIHGYVEFSVRRELPKVAIALGIPENNIEPPKSKSRKFAKVNALAYLCHLKQPEKYKYSPEQVETFNTFDYVSFAQENKQNFENQSAVVKRQSLDQSLDFVLQKVQIGELNFRDIMLQESLSLLYANNQVKFKEALNFFGERTSWLRLEALRRKEYDLTIIYIQSKPGNGKSKLARDISEQVRKHGVENGYKSEIYSASSSNPFDDYLGEDILILDDLRSNSLSPSDWLKLFDPLNTSRMTARYRNKLVVPRIIIMVNYQEPELFFGDIISEDLNQFIRRINFKIIISPKKEKTFDYHSDYFFFRSRKLKQPISYSSLSKRTISLNYDLKEETFCIDDRNKFIDSILNDYILLRIFPNRNNNL